jgi:hypothetical protein
MTAVHEPPISVMMLSGPLRLSHTGGATEHGEDVRILSLVPTAPDLDMLAVIGR